MPAPSLSLQGAQLGSPYPLPPVAEETNHNHGEGEGNVEKKGVFWAGIF